MLLASRLPCALGGVPRGTPHVDLYTHSRLGERTGAVVLPSGAPITGPASYQYRTVSPDDFQEMLQLLKCSVRELADFIGVAYPALERWMRGETQPHNIYLRDVLAALDKARSGAVLLPVVPITPPPARRVWDPPAPMPTLPVWRKPTHPRRTRPASWLYFFESTPDGLIKIGFSARPASRLAQIQSHLPPGVELRSLGVMRGGYSDEQSLHQHFAHLRVRGEWFQPADELLDFIRERAEVLADDFLHGETQGDAVPSQDNKKPVEQPLNRL